MTTIITPNEAGKQLDTLNRQSLVFAFDGVATMRNDTTYCVFTAFDQIGSGPNKVIFIPEQAIKAMRYHVLGNSTIKMDVRDLIATAKERFEEYKADPSRYVIEGPNRDRVERAFQLAKP